LRARFDSLDRAVGAGFEAVTVGVASREGLDSLAQTSRAGFELVVAASQTEREALGNTMTIGFKGLDAALQTLVVEMRRRENLEAELEEARQRLEHLSDPVEAIETLRQSLLEEKVGRQRVEVQLSAAERHIEALTATREALDFLKAVSQV
jgi:chromosome segregation ATPase